MATNREVVVRVTMVAGGNAGAALRANADAARGAAAPGSVGAQGNFAAMAQHRFQRREGMQDAENIRRYGEAAGAVANFTNKLEEAGVVRASMLGLAAATGAVAAASPAAFETLFGSVKLLAGEFGIMLIPAVVQVSNFLQGMARGIRNLNEATGGVLGKVVSFGAVVALGGVVVSKVVGLALPVISLGRSLFAAATAANVAASSLTKVAVTGAAGGIAGGTVGGMGGRFAGKVGIAAAGVGLGQAAGSAIGGTAGGYVAAATSGAFLGGMVGSFAGPMGTAVGAAIGAGVGLITEAVSVGFQSSGEKLAASMGFKGGSMELGTVGDFVQSQSIRDPMEQAKFEQEMRAMERLIEEVQLLRQQSQMRIWQANQ